MLVHHYEKTTAAGRLEGRWSTECRTSLEQFLEHLRLCRPEVLVVRRAGDAHRVSEFVAVDVPRPVEETAEIRSPERGFLAVGQAVAECGLEVLAGLDRPFAFVIAEQFRAGVALVDEVEQFPGLRLVGKFDGEPGRPPLRDDFAGNGPVFGQYRQQRLLDDQFEQTLVVVLNDARDLDDLGIPAGEFEQLLRIAPLPREIQPDAPVRPVIDPDRLQSGVTAGREPAKE